jgi:predicted DNA-binding transcriptional regulator YafY
MSEKYVGWIVQIIYQDAKGAITQRTISVWKVTNENVLAYDFGKHAPRSLKTNRILAIQPVGRTA